jgi:ParB family chromosome partitioning protein
VIDLEGLGEFDASAVLEDARGKPLMIALEAIEFDPKQPRRNIDPRALQELAHSIETLGVLQPVSLRAHPTKKGRYIVIMGERRVRASMIAKRSTIPAFVEEKPDPYAQVVENIQREDLSPSDLARFLAEREKEGHSRAYIAERLGKSRSFITEAARLNDAPAPIAAAYEQGRIADTRTLYLLVRAFAHAPERVMTLLAGNVPITREAASAAAGAQRSTHRINGEASRNEQAPAARKPANGFIVEVDGRKGHLNFRTQPSRTTTEVIFDDGQRDTVELARVTILSWTTL